MISYTCKNDVELQLINKVFNFLNIKISVHNTISYNFKINYVRKGETTDCTSVYQFIYLLGDHYYYIMTPYLYCKDAVKLCEVIFNISLHNRNYVIFDDCNTPKVFAAYTTKNSFFTIDSSGDSVARVECTDIREFVDFYNWLYKTNYKVKDMENNNKMPELKPGYCVETDHDYNTSYLIFKNSIGKLCFINADTQSWNVISDNFIDKITTIYETGNTTLKDKCIWKKPKETVLTMQEIANKFGVDVNTLKIKK